ncbi:hypothetical protein HKD42_11735 [Altererythrobacter sp. RZ02]|uniref:Uncharacterized protein n=1 Tax=Pontixanthobacter rizhaonensis TaxID=2730337 RepID=A0A848QQ06_9SPHN|nr:hypothetical protein [Pontixanthobacter rizhaonensis]NMW32733.1 hypothetical protein [Pontixanthobacter rizhaonensis]
MLDPGARIALVCERERLGKRIDDASTESLYAASIVGWDFTNDRSAPDPPNFGMWRTPLLLTGSCLTEIDPSRPAVVHAEMTRAELYNGFWRLARILPEAQDTYADEDFVKTAPGDFYSTVARRNSAVRPLADRDWLIFSLFGHTNRDAADFVHAALIKEPEIGRMLASKRFEEALEICPDLLDWKWPPETLARWETTGGKDYLPPFLFLVLLSEFQRLAQNVTAQITLSFRADGSRLTIASAVEDLAAVNSDYVGSGYKIFENCIAGLTTLVPLQTYALVPEERVMSSRNALAGIKHTEKAFCILNDAISNGPEDTLARLSGSSDQSRSGFVAQAVIAHPDHRRDRKVRGGKVVVRTEYLAKHYGLNWIEHAYFGQFQLASAAEAFNMKYRHARLPKRAPHNKLSIVSRRQAIARIANAWLETAHTAAYKKLCREFEIVQARNERGSELPSSFCGNENAKPQTVATKKRFIGTHFEESVEPSLSIVDTNVKIKARLLSNMEKLAARKPVKGLPGFTAEYRPTLWYEMPKKLNDIGFWIGRRLVAQQGKIANLPLTSPLIVQEILSDIDLYRYAPSRIEDRAAQNLAMTLGEFSLDPMHAFFRRKGIKFAGWAASMAKPILTYLHH